MKPPALLLLACAGCLCHAQPHCSPTALSAAAARVRSLQALLKTISRDASGDVPASARDGLSQLKDALTESADAALSCAGPSASPVALQTQMIAALNALPAALDRNATGLFGDELIVTVSRPSKPAGLLKVEFTMDIPCGDDNVLLLYALRDGAWRRLMRWQAAPLKDSSGALGDFFVSGVLSPPDGNTAPLVVIAHGTPWCTSRFSRFAIDLLAPSTDRNQPKVIWHTERSYDRSPPDSMHFRSSDDTFELRVNDWLLITDDISPHRIVYHYRVDEHRNVIRIPPIATNARGFVEEWLDAPWSESSRFSDPGNAAALRPVYDRFISPDTKGAHISHTHGPVRACTTPHVFQVQVKPDADKTRYFHVRETGDGYIMLSAPTQPDPTCNGGNLMPQ